MQNNTLNILYLTPLWAGVRPFFLEALDSANGMPAFFNVLKRLLDDSRIARIHVIAFYNGPKVKINIPPQYSTKLVVYPVFIQGRFSLLLKSVYALIKGIHIARSQRVNVVYGHGSIAALGSAIGMICGIRHYRRIYGTFLYRKVKNRSKIYLVNSMEYLTFRLPCQGLIVTNDGTHGDKVFHSIGSETTPLHFLLNGVDRPDVLPHAICSIADLPPNFLSYIARVDRWKRQHLLIQALAILINERKISVPKTYFVGQLHDKPYVEELRALVQEHSLQQHVVFTGPVPKSDTQYLLSRALLTFSLYDFSNLGNVFLEAISTGSLMLAISEEGSLDSFPPNIFLKAESADAVEIADQIERVLLNPDSFREMRGEASAYANSMLKTWEERVNQEYEIVINGKRQIAETSSICLSKGLDKRA